MQLGTILLKKSPLVLVLGYFRCPGLCDVVRGDLFEALTSTSGLKAGTDYSLVALSIETLQRQARTLRAG